MTRRSKAKRGIKRILEWLLDRDVVDLEIATALGKPAATYSRRKDAADFPTFEELEKIGTHFGIHPRWLQVQFGYLDEDEFKVRPTPFMVNDRAKRLPAISELPVREDAPPLG